MSRRRLALIIYVAAVSLALLSTVALFASGWWPAVPHDAIGFGATTAQCLAAYGVAEDASNAPAMDCAQNLFYGKHLWDILVGFDAAGRAEMFVFYKARLSPFRSAPLSNAERKALLDRFADGSTWTPLSTKGDEPQWERADQGAAAVYIATNRCLVLVNRKCYDRKAEKLKSEVKSEP